MIEPRIAVEPATDGYPIHTLTWPTAGKARGPC